MTERRYFPAMQEFQARAEQANLIPVYSEVMADLETPVSALLKIDRGDSAFLLESVESGMLGRYSFIGANPTVFFEAKGRKIRIERGGELKEYETSERDPLEDLKQLMQKYQPAPAPDLPPFYGGAVGYLSYDMVHFFENIPMTGEDDLNLPDMLFMVTDTILIFDHVSKKIKVVANAFIDGDAEEAYQEAKRKIDALVEKLEGPLPDHGFGADGAAPIEVEFNRTRENFCQGVEKCREHIIAGDIFQVILSMRQKMQIDASALDVYRALRTVNPSPYMFYIRRGDLCLVGSSPEILVKLDKGRVRYRPLAGTRWRGETEEEDQRIAEELLADPKERAEHVMLIDLGRNDIGRVCKYHTVEVTELMVVERYSHVMHIVSNIEGEIDPRYNPYDLMRAVFPAGTVSGAPKVRAMQIIDEQEPTRRGPYGGAVGYFGFSGNLDSGIILRTIVMKDNTAYVQSGAGVVYDSRPEYEYNECLNKARGLVRAIEMAQKGSIH